MRTYEKDQSDSVMFEGQDAQKLIQLRQEMDIEADRICQELHEAYNRAEQRFKELESEYAPRFESILKNTELSSVPLENVAFDYSNGEKYGIVFAHQISFNPIEHFLNMLREQTNKAPTAPEDSIEVSFKEPNAQERWGLNKKQTETV